MRTREVSCVVWRLVVVLAGEEQTNRLGWQWLRSRTTAEGRRSADVVVVVRVVGGQKQVKNEEEKEESGQGPKGRGAPSRIGKIGWWREREERCRVPR